MRSSIILKRLTFLATLLLALLVVVDRYQLAVVEDSIELSDQGLNHVFFVFSDMKIDKKTNYSSSLSQDGQVVASVSTYFLVDGADQHDMLIQNYSGFTRTNDVQGMTTFQKEGRQVSFFNAGPQVTVYEYDQASQKTIEPLLKKRFSRQADESTYHSFTSNDYRDVLLSVVYNDASKPPVSPPITNDQEADSYIQKKANERGYMMRVQLAQNSLVNWRDHIVADKVKSPVEALIKVAGDQNNDLEIISSYRSFDEQRELFLSRLIYDGDTKDFLTGKFDQQIDDVLGTTAPPGMSKHHSGYTFDLRQRGGTTFNFRNTESFAWISKNNYLAAKQLGFVPSYPEGADNQGPNPEAWEYTYVGHDVLTDCGCR